MRAWSRHRDGGRTASYCQLGAHDDAANFDTESSGHSDDGDEGEDVGGVGDKNEGEENSAMLVYRPTMLACADTLPDLAHLDDSSIHRRCLALRWYTATTLTAGVGAGAAILDACEAYVHATWVA